MDQHSKEGKGEGKGEHVNLARSLKVKFTAADVKHQSLGLSPRTEANLS